MFVDYITLPNPVTFKVIDKIRMAFEEVDNREKAFFYGLIESKSKYSDKEINNLNIYEEDLFKLNDKDYLCKVSHINNLFEAAIEKLVYPFVGATGNYFLAGKLFFIKSDSQYIVGTAEDQRYMSFGSVINDPHIYILLFNKLNCLKYINKEA